MSRIRLLRSLSRQKMIKIVLQVQDLVLISISTKSSCRNHSNVNYQVLRNISFKRRIKKEIANGFLKEWKKTYRKECIRGGENTQPRLGYYINCKVVTLVIRLKEFWVKCTTAFFQFRTIYFFFLHLHLLNMVGN